MLKRERAALMRDRREEMAHHQAVLSRPWTVIALCVVDEDDFFGDFFLSAPRSLCGVKVGSLFKRDAIKEGLWA